MCWGLGWKLVHILMSRGTGGQDHRSNGGRKSTGHGRRDGGRQDIQGGGGAGRNRK